MTERLWHADCMHTVYYICMTVRSGIGCMMTAAQHITCEMACSLIVSVKGAQVSKPPSLPDPLWVCAKLSYQAVGLGRPALIGVLEGNFVGPLPCLVSGITVSSWTDTLVRGLSIAVNTLQPMTLLSTSQYIRTGHNVLCSNKQ